MHALMGLFMDNLWNGWQGLEGKTSRLFNCKKPSKSREFGSINFDSQTLAIKMEG
jgi:hypothetical protein